MHVRFMPLVHRACAIAMLAIACRDDHEATEGETPAPPASTGAHGTDTGLPGSTAAEPLPATSTGSTHASTGEVADDETRGSSTGAGSTSTSTSTSSSSATVTTDGTDDTTGTDTGAVDECALAESFEGLPDGSPWPAPWVAAGGVLLADVQAGRGRLVPVTSRYSLARMFVPLSPSCVDVEITLTFELTEASTQGIGLYLRQNGGYLQDTVPPGAGYASFSQAFTVPAGISLWREVDGDEMILAPFSPHPIVSGVAYAVRFRVTQLGAAMTRLRTRIWPVREIEPMAWDVDLVDDAPSLQGVGGGVAIDAWSQLMAGTPADLFVDDIVVTAVP